jgi:hypothetical protein
VNRSFMTNSQMENSAKKIVETLKAHIEKRKGLFVTEYGRKTERGLKATIFNILAENNLKAQST